MSGGRLTIWSLVMAVGCGGVEDDTCEVPTDELSIIAQVVDSGYDLRASVDFEQGDRRGRSVSLHLCESDRLVVNGAELVEIVKASRIEYVTTWPVDAARSFRFVLEREEQKQRLMMEVDLPPAFEILSPMSDDRLSTAQELHLEWAPADDDGTMLVGIREELGGGSCVQAEQEGHTYKERGGVRVPDSGQWVIPANALHHAGVEPCPVSYLFTRLNLGEYPTTVASGGRVEARVERQRDGWVDP